MQASLASYPLDALGTLPPVVTTICLQTLSLEEGRAKLPHLRTSGLEASHSKSYWKEAMT